MQEYFLKESYCKYLRDVRKLKESSVKHYLDAIQYISKYLKNMGCLTDSLYEVFDISTLDDLKQILRNDVEFKSLDKRGHQMYSSGFNNYYRFACGDELHNQADIIKLDVAVKRPAKQENVQESWRRSSIVKQQVLRAAEYKCEYDERHQTFIAKSNGFPYMEGHHAIPISRQGEFQNSLDIYANVICLCPICHRLLHYGQVDAKENVLNKLYYQRADRLAISGIRVSLEQFKNFAI